MRSLTESIIGRRGNIVKKIIPQLERALSNDRKIEELANKYNMPFAAMKDLFNKVKDEIGKVVGYSEEDRERWLDDFLENNDIEIDDDTLDRIAKEAGRHVDELKDVIEDMQFWLRMQIR